MDSLMRIADEEGIFVSYRNLATTERRLLGLYFYDPIRKTPFIMLDHSLKERLPLHRSVMAEEIGHYFTVPQGNFITPYTSYTCALTLSRDERRALRWACDFLLPMDTFYAAVANGIVTIHELAEHFNVTPWLINRRIDFARAKYPWMYRVLATNN